MRRTAPQPCIIEGLLDDWPSFGKWSVDWFAQEYPDLALKCGDDQDGERVEMDMSTYKQYCATQRDDVPLYVFDEEFGAEDRCS